MFEDKISGYLLERNNLKSLVNLLVNMDKEQKAEQEAAVVIKRAAIDKYHPSSNAARTIDFYKQVMESAT
jgi:hypothetical protein